MFMPTSLQLEKSSLRLRASEHISENEHYSCFIEQSTGLLVLISFDGFCLKFSLGNEHVEKTEVKNKPAKPADQTERQPNLRLKFKINEFFEDLKVLSRQRQKENEAVTKFF